VQASIQRASSGMSDFGSEMGAANLAQVSLSEVIMPPPRRLTCPDVDQQAHCPTVCSVRIEGVMGSNPLSSTERSSRFRGGLVHVWALVIFASGSDVLRVWLVVVG
jgi:hypothetical protein